MGEDIAWRLAAALADENARLEPDRLEDPPFNRPTVAIDLDLAEDLEASIARLRRILAHYGDRVRMATSHRPDWQQEIDDALGFVADNPEPAP